MKHHLGLLALTAGLFAAPVLSHSAQPIVGSWYASSQDFHSLATFLADGRYYLSTDSTNDPQHTGVEWGTWSWNEATGLVTAHAVGDTNGDWGLASDIDGDVYVDITGTTATVTQPDSAQGESETRPRVTHVPGSIVGAWFLDSGYSQASVAFFADGTYFLGVAGTDAAETGVERGTYSWDAATGQLRILGVLTNTSTQSGLANPEHPEIGYYLATLSGSTLSLREVPDQPDDVPVLIPPEAVGAVPEPSTLAMLLAGAGLLGITRRRG